MLYILKWFIISITSLQIKKCRGSNVIEKHSTMQELKELSQNKDEEMSDLCRWSRFSVF